MLGQTVARIFTPEDVSAGRARTEMACALEESAGNDELWHLRKEGGRLWANGEMTPLRDDADHAAGFVKVLRDRTQQRCAIEAVRDSQTTTACCSIRCPKGSTQSIALA